MATNIQLNSQDPKNNRQYLKPVTRPQQAFVPLQARRSTSLENLSNNKKPELLINPSYPIIPNTLSSSLQSLCVRIRPYQLLPELNENIAESSNEHDFNWWRYASHLRPLLQNIIVYRNFRNEFLDYKDEDEKIFCKFTQSKRYKRRDAICSTLDRLYYNEQTILFSTIATDLQIEYNLVCSGFRL
ncbi:unnamed protein product [Adineta steineri]|uniref:Uncharacterized protein n=1 Tax=Adineta steineri TaxID=433720 RepID=A0A819MAH7_9BILA|nr:unnamed protein product [Adineta steineri]CAF3976490.1 unnamed protein product [Adineta steineri]